MRLQSCAIVFCIALALSCEANALPIAGCDALPSNTVRLATFEDPAGTDQVNAINNSCVAAGWADSLGNLSAAIWTGTSIFYDSAHTAVEMPDLLIAPYSDDGPTEAMDINGDDVLVWYEHADPIYEALPHYAIFDIASDTRSAPINPAVSWTYSLALTNSSGWSVEYGPNWEGYENAYLENPNYVAETPEPNSSFLCLTGLAALVLFGSLRKSRSVRRHQT